MNIPSLNILHFQFCVIKIGSWPLFLNNLVHTMKILHFLQTVVLKGGELRARQALRASPPTTDTPPGDLRPQREFYDLLGRISNYSPFKIF